MACAHRCLLLFSGFQSEPWIKFALGHRSRDSDLRLIGLRQPPGNVSRIKLRMGWESQSSCKISATPSSAAILPRTWNTHSAKDKANGGSLSVGISARIRIRHHLSPRLAVRCAGHSPLDDRRFKWNFQLSNQIFDLSRLYRCALCLSSDAIPKTQPAVPFECGSARPLAPPSERS